MDYLAITPSNLRSEHTPGRAAHQTDQSAQPAALRRSSTDISGLSYRVALDHLQHLLFDARDGCYSLEKSSCGESSSKKGVDSSVLKLVE